MRPGTKSTTTAQKPLVVLIGWLGSQPKNLRRYEALYQRAGFQVRTRIATPTQVVQATLRPPLTWSVPTKHWPHSNYSSASSSVVSSIQDLAWQILGQVHQVQSPVVVFHVFSNGGCFLWEQILRILDIDSSNKEVHEDCGMVKLDSQQIAALSDFRARVRGCVFDSCPGADMTLISEAIKYCSWRERMMVLTSCGTDYLFLNGESVQRKLSARGESYICFLTRHQWKVPQLYLYSGDDPLAQADAIDGLIASRRELFGEHLVWKRRWDSSPHCAHLLAHPKDYEGAIESFISFCTSEIALVKL
jgi:hypothetical protein